MAVSNGEAEEEEEEEEESGESSFGFVWGFPLESHFVRRVDI